MKLINLITYIPLLFIITCSDNDPITIVRKGTVEYDRQRTIDEVFSNYSFFKNYGWKYRNNIDNKVVVLFFAELDTSLFKTQLLDYLKNYEKRAKRKLAYDTQKRILERIKTIQLIFKFPVDQQTKTFSLKQISSYTIAKPDFEKDTNLFVGTYPAEMIKEVYHNMEIKLDLTYLHKLFYY